MTLYSTAFSICKPTLKWRAWVCTSFCCSLVIRHRLYPAPVQGSAGWQAELHGLRGRTHSEVLWQDFQQVLLPESAWPAGGLLQVHGKRHLVWEHQSITPVGSLSDVWLCHESADRNGSPRILDNSQPGNLQVYCTLLWMNPILGSCTHLGWHIPLHCMDELQQEWNGHYRRLPCVISWLLHERSVEHFSWYVLTFEAQFLNT